MESQKMIQEIRDALNTFDASGFMAEKRRLDSLKPSASMSEGYINSMKKQNVEKHLQVPLKKHLEHVLSIQYPQLQWIVEKELNGCGDSADVYASDSTDWEIIIEIDATRADQVAKKIVSRFFHLSDSLKKNIVYIALCYPGTQRMSVNECEKFMNYGAKIITKIHKNAFFIRAFVKDDKIVSE